MTATLDPAASSATPSEWLTADQAAAALGVSKATLYAYVSREKLRALPQAGGARSSLYRRSEVERLASRRGQARQPRQVARATLDWGLPVLESGLTLIERQQPHYRGRSAIDLARDASLEGVAGLLWACADDEAFGAPPPALPAGWVRPLARLAPLALPDRLLAAFTLLQTQLPTVDARASAALRSRHAAALVRVCAAAALGRPPAALPIHAQFAAAWSLAGRAADALRAALVLCADHELNASSFVARCVASTGADLGKAVSAGLAALSGPLHGGMTARVEAQWDEAERATSPRAALQRRLARGETIAGFGHPLYPDGDPRAAEILRRLPRGPASRAAAGFAAAAEALGGSAPTLDFALVALRRALGAPEGGAYAVFAVGRSVGWLAHAIEQRESGALIRPRAAYVGERPAPAQPARPQPRGPASAFAPSVARRAPTGSRR